MGYPSVFPTGTILYDKEKAWNGYTIFPSGRGALLLDMNGNEVQRWAGLGGFPNKILPGGYVMGTTGTRSGKYAYQDQIDLVQVDWEGKIVWKFRNTELIADPGMEEPEYQARQHHDYQREGSSVGYYYPGGEPRTDGGNTLILTHENVYNHEISDKRLIDDKIIEVDWEGNILWSWRASDHFEEMGFDEAAKNVLFRNPGLHEEAGGDWLQRWEKINGTTREMNAFIRTILFLMPEMPIFLELSARRQERLSGDWDRILTKAKQPENWAGLSGSTICT